MILRIKNIFAVTFTVKRKICLTKTIQNIESILDKFKKVYRNCDDAEIEENEKLTKSNMEVIIYI